MQNLLFSKNIIIRKIIKEALIGYTTDNVEIKICERSKFGVAFYNDLKNLNWFSAAQEKATIEALNMINLREACKILKANNIKFKLVKKHDTGCLGYLCLYIVIERF